MAYDSETTMGMTVIVPVQSRAELKRFVRVPMQLNAKDPNWISPLVMERLSALSDANPFFEHAQVRMWLAVRDGRDVGRISAQIDALAPGTPGRTVGHFGLICAEDDATVFSALFEAAETWLKERGCDTVLGPFNLSVNEEVGLLVSGFDAPPMVMMGHDAPHAGPRIEAEGYRKAKDLRAYLVDLDKDLPEAVLRRVRRGAPEGVVLRKLDMKRLEAEVSTLTDIANDAWSDNWGYTPTTEAETRHLAKALKDVIDPDLIWFAQIDGEDAGFIVLLPNVNEAIADLDGRLLPFGFAKLLWRLKVRGLKTARVPLMGVRRRFAGVQRGMILPFHLIDKAATAARAKGYRQVELSWILEDNAPMVNICERVGAAPYKTYRLYEKSLKTNRRP
ncbi:dATP pyrophosphohydrolase [Caulobacter segnis]|uniref:dATP pyrophosphohydrolase n=1 Tax=Caulobacter segnis TaxID=88688 RepID=UPI00240F7E70|nr:dATP pyrophosphohydrolase [Caulobacter segnis]MDG2520463.1 dATP pyrophosphohydrolase [Caulobacter segnis]